MNESVYKHLINLEIDNAIRTIELYESSMSNGNNPIEYQNELLGRLKIVDKTIEYLCSRCNMTPLSLYTIYQNNPRQDDLRIYMSDNLALLQYPNFLDRPVGIKAADVRGAYRELFTNLEGYYNETYFEDGKLKPMLQDNINVAQQYFSQYRYLRRIKSEGNSKQKLSPVVNWLTGNVSGLEDDINSYNNRVRELNEVIAKNTSSNTPLPFDFEEKKQILENDRKEIIEKCNAIVEKLDVNRYIEGDTPPFFQELDEGLKRYNRDVRDYKAICKELNAIQKELDSLALEYDNATPERQVEIQNEMNIKFQSGKDKFKRATKMRKDIKERSDVLFSTITLESVKSSKTIVADFISVFNINEEDIASINLDDIKEEALKRYILKYRDLGLAQQKITEFFKNKKRLLNPNQIFDQDVYEDGKFKVNKFTDAKNAMKTKSNRKKSGKNKNPLGNSKIDQVYPVDLQPLEDLDEYTKGQEPPKPTPMQPVEPIQAQQEPSQFLTIEMLMAKIYTQGVEERINPKESHDRRYRASKVKIFGIADAWRNATRYKRQGRAYVVEQGFKALITTLFTIVPVIPIFNGIKKLWGKTQNQKFKDFYEQIEKNIEALSDEEAEFAMKHYAELIDKGIRNTDVVRKALEKRINALIQKKTMKYNEELYNLIILVNTFANAARNMKAKAVNPKTSEEERKTALNLSKDLYEKAGVYLNKYVNTYEEGQKLVHGDGFEAYKHQSEAHGSGMNITGGIFARNAELDLNELDELAEFSKFKNPNLPAEERVEKFMDYTDKSIENTKYSRNILNLGSKSSKGLVEYNPFISSINYEKDPLIKGLVTDIFMIISIANIATNITNMIKHNMMVAAQEQANIANQQLVDKAIADANNKIRSGNSAIDLVNESGQYGKSQVSSMIEGVGRDSIGDVAHAKDLNEISAAIGNDMGLMPNDQAVHSAFASVSNEVKDSVSNTLAGYQSGQMSLDQVINSLKSIKAKSTGILRGEISQLDPLAQVQHANGYDYTHFFNLANAVAMNPDSSTIAIDAIHKLASLPHMDSLSLCEQLSLVNPTLSTQGALSSVLATGALGAGLIATKGDKKFTKTETLLRDLDSEENKELQEEITQTVTKMKGQGHSDEEISKVVSKMIVEGKKEVPFKNV